MSPSDEPLPEESGGAEESGRRKPLIFGAAVVVVLVVAGVVVYLLTRDDSTPTAGGPDVPSIANPTGSSSVGPARPPGGVTATITAPSSTPSAAAGGGDAREVAEEAAEAITTSDLKTLGELSCDPGAVNPDENTFPADAKVEVVGDPQINGDTATVNVKVMIADAPPATVPMPLIKQDGHWCIAN